MDAANKNDKLTNKFDRGGGAKTKKKNGLTQFKVFTS